MIRAGANPGGNDLIQTVALQIADQPRKPTLLRITEQFKQTFQQTAPLELFYEGVQEAILRIAQRAVNDDPGVAGGSDVLSESAR